MKSLLNFFKQVIAATFGVTLFSFILYFSISNYILYKVNKQFKTNVEQTLKDNSILHFKIDGEVVDHVMDRFHKDNIILLSEVNLLLEAAAEDPKIQGILLEIGEKFSGGLDNLEALRQSLKKFKKNSDKPIVIYSPIYIDSLFALATVADYRIVHPSGILIFKGLSMKTLFYKRLLDRFDIKPEFFRAGKYKVASMPYVSDHMTPYDKEQRKKILHAKHRFLFKTISSNPNVKADDLTHILNNQPLLKPEEAQKYHLIDHVGYKDSANKYFNNYLDPDHDLLKENDSQYNTRQEADYQPNEKPNFISYNAYKSILQAKSTPIKYTKKRTKIGVLPLEGAIVTKDDESRTISKETTIPILEKYAEDDEIAAIIIIIDSPGGLVIPSDTIAHHIEEIKKIKPVICVIRNGAFSGGIYIASSCSKIIASPLACLGSIGVWTLGINLKDAVSNHLFIDVDGVKTHEHADIYQDSFHAYSDKEKEFIQNDTNYYYEQFKKHVARNRGLTKEQIEKASEGRIFTAEEGLELGLLDEIVVDQASLDRAIELCRELTDLKQGNPELLYPVRTLTLKRFTYLISTIFNQQQMKLPKTHQRMYQAHHDTKASTQAPYTN